MDSHALQQLLGTLILLAVFVVGVIRESRFNSRRRKRAIRQARIRARKALGLDRAALTGAVDAG